MNIKFFIVCVLIGKEEGDSVEVCMSGGVKSYEIVEIVYV